MTVVYAQHTHRQHVPCFMCVRSNKNYIHPENQHAIIMRCFVSFHLSHTLSQGLSHGSSHLTILLTGVLNNICSAFQAFFYSRSKSTRYPRYILSRSLSYNQILGNIANLHHSFALCISRPLCLEGL